MHLRKPTVADVPAMVALMRPHILAERLLPRSPRQVAERLRDFVVAEIDGEIVGVASISLVDMHLAEVGAIAAEQPQVAEALTAHLLDEARQMGVADAFVLTDDAAFFERIGFRRTELAAIPEKRDRQCLRCARLPRCRQVALTVALGEPWALAAK